MQRPVDLFLPLPAQKWLQRQQKRLLLFVHFSRLPQHCGGRLRQRLLLSPAELKRWAKLNMLLIGSRGE